MTPRKKKVFAFIASYLTIMTVHSCMHSARGELRYEDELPEASQTPTHVMPAPLETEHLNKRSRAALARIRGDAALETQDDSHYNDDSDQSMRGVLVFEPQEDPRIEQRALERVQVIQEMKQNHEK